MDAQVRLADRVVFQIGTSLGDIADDAGEMVPTVVVPLSSAKLTELRAALGTPNRGDVHLSDAGAITIDPAPPPPPPTPEDTQYSADRRTIRAFMQAANGTVTPVQRDAFLKAFVRAVAYKIGQLEE